MKIKTICFNCNKKLFFFFKRLSSLNQTDSNLKLRFESEYAQMNDEMKCFDPSSEPICDLNADFGENVAIAYGPWAEACRVAFVSYFFPADFTDATPTKLPESDERKIPLIMDITLAMNGRTTINLWFMRHDELNTVAVIIKNGLSIKVENPLVIAEEGYKTTMRFIMKDVQFLPTSGFRKLISYEELIMECNVFVPKQYGQLQKCEILMKMNRVTMWCAWDHIAFMQDFVSEVSANYTEDLAQFVPQIWNYRIEFTNAKFIFVTNDKNWVDARYVYHYLHQ
uniref:DUF616 domain-containing protein n=1 Tax=Loa loa TaxID=7209 RepID=A0A1I7VWG6_LOALO